MIEFNSMCTGCGACVQICPKSAIHWIKKEFDFLYPEVDKNLCVKCGLCKKVCTIDKNLVNPAIQKAYAAVNTDADVLRNSTSGGAFIAIAETVLNKGGIVYGCIMDEDFKVCHTRCTKKDDLQKCMGSKYVQSDINATYCLAEHDLKSGLFVLFSGTPCQIAGLYGYLQKRYENLITIDIVCHGVGSQGYFDKYLQFEKQRRNGSLKEIRFRSKRYVGWSCVVVAPRGNEMTRKYKPYFNYDNYYYSYFLSGDIYRQSCYSCKYANLIRQGDFTLGDFWGVESLDLGIETSKGCSLLIANSKRAIDFLSLVTDKLQCIEVDINDAARKNGQLRAPSKKSKIRSQLLEEYKKYSANEIQRLYKRRNHKGICLGIIKRYMPYNLRRVLRKYI